MMDDHAVRWTYSSFCFKFLPLRIINDKLYASQQAFKYISNVNLRLFHLIPCYFHQIRELLQKPSVFDLVKSKRLQCFQVRGVDAKEAFRLQKENKFVILDVRPVAEFKEVTYIILLPLIS